MNSRVARIVTSAAAHVVARDVVKAYDAMGRVAGLGRTELEELQLVKLNTLLDRFLRAPFYEELLASHNVPRRHLQTTDELSSLPVVTKEFITRNLDALAGNSPKFKRDSTSGSTGVNFQFLKSPSMMVARSAALRRAYRSIGIEMWGDRKVVIWGTHPASARRARLTRRLKLWFLNATFWQAFGLDEASCLACLESLGSIKPLLLEGYPGYLAKLAEVGERAGMQPWSPKAVVSSGEMLLESDRAAIEEYFRSPVFDRYGTREFGLVAQQCPERSALHVPPTRFILETSEDGGLLVTDLDNTATPFIRYAVGDLGTVEDVDCSCGHRGQSVLSLQGRAHDTIATPSGRLLPGQFWTLLTRSVPGIDQFQVVQRSPSVLELRVTSADALTVEVERRLRSGLHELAGAEVSLDIVRVDQIAPGPSGKRKFVISQTDSTRV